MLVDSGGFCDWDSQMLNRENRRQVDREVESEKRLAKSGGRRCCLGVCVCLALKEEKPAVGLKWGEADEDGWMDDEGEPSEKEEEARV